ncbi:alpha/beta hydrolase [Microbacterium sp.]|uniref:alpha/beta hydrolase n=1 Tax=Microbacterium sp. TaxID=51671 RepID=UPI003A8B6CA6
MTRTRPARPARIVGVVAAAAAVSLALSGCVALMIPDARPAKPPVTDGVPENLLPYYGQTLSWEPCAGTGSGVYDCTTVTAPLSWDEPTAGEIELAVVRRQADAAEPVGSLLTNPGGPGASGFDLIAQTSSFAVTEPLLEAFDVIGFDPRGVGRSTSVSCLDAADTDAFLFDIPAAARGTDAWEAELTTRNAEFAHACEANSDGILPFITTVNAARDLDLLRAVLGDSELYYLGYSYGTFLGATYADLFPERVGRLVLDGAIDPSVSGLAVGTTQALGFESALRAYMADCLEATDCPFRGALDDAMNDLGVLLERADADPLPNADGRRLGADSLMTAIVTALYSQESWPYLTMALSGVLEGDASIAFLLADSYYSRDADGTYRDNSLEAFTAYNCVDYPAEDDPDAEAAANELIATEAPTIAPYWAGVDVCESWPAPPTGTRGAITAAGAAPIVVVGTTNDPATPYEWSVSLADQLTSGVLITREGEGHTGFNKGNRCVDSAVNDYLIDGTAPEDGLTCG